MPCSTSIKDSYDTFRLKNGKKMIHRRPFEVRVAKSENRQSNDDDDDDDDDCGW